MNDFSFPVVLWAATIGSIVLAGMVILWLRSRRKSPQEKERLRRLAVYSCGRLTEGELLDAPEGALSDSLVYYTYRAFGVEYTAAQDISTLTGLIAPEHCRPGNPTSVKYDPRLPANSIVICENWSGLQAVRNATAIQRRS